ncbi:Cell-surface hemin receptor [Corynebacterium pseudotuberculosis]|nr:Cell-surface hemin receptor [Corynebacterium pseudotuberculosis]
MKWSCSLKNQRFRHILTTTVACATLISLTVPNAIAEPESKVVQDPSAIATSDSTPELPASEETTVDAEDDKGVDPNAISAALKDLDKEIKGAGDKAVSVADGILGDKGAAEEKKPAAAAAVDRKDKGSTLTWGVRSSFNNYIGGPTAMLDDATQNDKKNQFTFNLESVSYESDTEKLEAKFKGGVHYQKYCDDNTNHTGCKLDLKIENPRIVMSKDGSHVFAKVSSKKYNSNETYTNSGTDDAKPIAQLYTANAVFEEKDGKVTWSEIPTLLTQDGSEMFSNFYPVNSSLDPLTFSFDESKLEGDKDSYKRLSTDNAKYVVSSQKFDNQVNYELHRELFKFKDHIIVATSDHRFTPNDKAGFALLNRDLAEKSFKGVKINGYGAVAFDEAKGDLYYVAKKTDTKPFDDDTKSLYKIHVDVETGFGEPQLVHTFAEEITAVGYNPASKDVVAVTQKQTAIVNQSTITPVVLPEQSELVKESGFTEPKNLYGSIVSYSPAVNELLPVEDGSFVLNGDSASAKKDGKQYYGLMVSINPKNAKLLGESATENIGIQSSAARINRETIVRYNKNASESQAVAQSFRLKDGNLVKESADAITGTDADVKNWGNAFVMDDGTIMALDSKDGMIKHVDAKNFKNVQNEKTDEHGRKFESIALPKGAKTAEHQHGSILQLDKGTFYVPSFDDVKGESEETYALRKVYDPKFTPEAQKQGQEFPKVEEQKDTPRESKSFLSKTWKVVLGVLGALGGILGILGAANHFFGEQIRSFLDRFHN